MNTEKEKKQRILIYAPIQGVPQYSFPMTKIAKTLLDLGNKVDLLSCRGLQSDACIVQISAHKELCSIEQKAKICKWCKGYENANKPYFSGSGYLDDHFDSSLDEIKLNKILDSFEIEDIESFHINDIPIARIACYNFLLRFQIVDISKITLEQFKHFKNKYFSATLKTFFSYQRFLKNHSYDKVIVGDPFYSQNQVIVQLNKFHNIKTVSVYPSHHHKYYFDHYMLCNDDSYKFSAKVLKEFSPENMIYTQNARDITLEYIESLWNGKQKSIFSTPKNDDIENVRTICGIRKNHERVVLLVMSSLDESYATDFSVYEGKMWSGYNLLFDSQVEWISQCIDYFKDKKNYKLIIRCHPREYVQGKTATIKAIEGLSNYINCENVYFNFPSDKISIYDLLNISDLCLMRRSSIGIQAGLVGIPAISYLVGNELYPSFYSPSSVKEYFECISEVLYRAHSRSYRYVELQFKWLIHYYSHSSFKLDSDNYWNIFPKADSEDSAKVKRKELDLPVHEIDVYNRFTEVSKLDKKVLDNYIQKDTEVWDIVSNQDKKSQDMCSEDILIKKLVYAIFGKDVDKVEHRELLNRLSRLNKSIDFYLQNLDIPTKMKGKLSERS